MTSDTEWFYRFFFCVPSSANIYSFRFNQHCAMCIPLRSDKFRLIKLHIQLILLLLLSFKYTSTLLLLLICSLFSFFFASCAWIYCSDGTAGNDWEGNYVMFRSCFRFYYNLNLSFYLFLFVIPLSVRSHPNAYNWPRKQTSRSSSPYTWWCVCVFCVCVQTQNASQHTISCVYNSDELMWTVRLSNV